MVMAAQSCEHTLKKSLNHTFLNDYFYVACNFLLCELYLNF